MLAMPYRPRLGTVLLALLALSAFALGGCDKCGNRVHLNVPSLQHACGDNAEAPH